MKLRFLILFRYSSVFADLLPRSMIGYWHHCLSVSPSVGKRYSTEAAHLYMHDDLINAIDSYKVRRPCLLILNMAATSNIINRNILHYLSLVSPRTCT